MIKPTIGRMVWFHDAGTSDDAQPNAAVVAYVHSDTMVNLAVFDANGVAGSRTSVFLWQGEGERPSSYYAEWMPYQLGQAARTEVAEAKVAEGIVPPTAQ